MVGRNRQDVAAGVVQDAVNAHGQALAVDHQRGPVTDIGVPERAGALCLPAQPHLAPAPDLPLAERDSIQTLLQVEAAHAAGRDGPLVEPPLGDERTQNDRHRRGRVFLADGEQ